MNSLSRRHRLRPLIVFLFLLSLLVLGLSACMVNGDNNGGGDQALLQTQAPTLMPTAPYTSSRSPTAIATGTATSALFPTSTSEPSATATATITPTATSLACWTQGGRIEQASLKTDQIRLPLDYRVYLPPCYDQQPERRYPVLFLIHGQSYTDDQWDRLGVDETANRLVAAGEIAPFLIVMPRDRYGGQPSENNFARVVVEELLPLIDQDYRTLPNREDRAIGGLSRGGGWSIHIAITEWELFGALGAHSPAIFYQDAQFMRVYLDQIPEDSYPRIYLDIGDRDRPGLMSAVVWFEKLLNQWGIAHEWYLFSGFHSEGYWQDHLETYLRWYAREW